jgi:hypothetical protein
MFWKNIWRFFKSIREKIASRKTSAKNNTTFDTAAIKIFGLDIEVSREVPLDGPPYELTVVVPRAECRFNKKTGTGEIIISSITIAHSPRFMGELKQERPLIPKHIAA